MTEKPYLTAFFFCERVLQESDNVPSAIRMIDVIGVPGADLSANADSGPTYSPLWMFIGFKNDTFQGTCNVEIVGRRPSGKELARNVLKIQFEPLKGTNVIIDARLTLPEAGTYWFELYVDGEMATKTPLIVSLAPNLSAAIADVQESVRSPSAKGDGQRGE